MSSYDNKPKIICAYGPKEGGYNAFNKSDDVTCQRAPLNEPEDLFQQFLIDDEIQEELDNEEIDDFDSDIDDYDDITDFGVDVALSQQAPIAAAAKKLAQRIKPRSKR